MARAVGLSKSTVQRVWAQIRLKQHRLDCYPASNDPQFGEKVADIIGLYMNPPQHTALFCVAGKTAMQALGRLDSVLPLEPGRAERHGFEYYPHKDVVAISGSGLENSSVAWHDGSASHRPRVHCIS